MSSFQMLDVAIGIIFTFLLLSLIATAVKELLETFLKTRATNLERGIRELLQDTTSSSTGLVADLYSHSLIAGLYKGAYIPKGKTLPSYIPSSNFALALLDNIAPANAENLSGSAGGGAISADAHVKSLQPLREAIINNKSLGANLKKAILALVDASGNDIDKVRFNIETWFNTSMDRTSGWYKRNSQWWLFFIGITIALIMNADTIAIYKSLMKDPTLRNSLVATAQEYVAANKDTATPSSNDASKQVIDNNAKKLYDLRLPIGWDWKRDSSDADYISNSNMAIPTGFIAWLLKIFGWIITALAISLGSSFWFDTLNKIMVIRSTVKPHEKSPEEKSQD